MYIWHGSALSIKDLQVGPNTKKAQAVLAVTLLTAIMTFSGCVFINNAVNNPAPTTTPFVVTITPTPTPTTISAPTATPVPTTAAREMSSDVKVMPFGDKGIIEFNSYPDDDRQYENMTIVLGNDGTMDAKNVMLTLTETDAHGGNILVQQKFDVGDLKRGERKDFTVVTDEHDQAGSILIRADLAWGANGEYYNPMTFIDMTKSIVWMIKL